MKKGKGNGKGGVGGKKKCSVARGVQVGLGWNGMGLAMLY